MVSAHRGAKRSRSPSEELELPSPRSHQLLGGNDVPSSKRLHVDYDPSGDESQVDVPRSSPFVGAEGAPSSVADDPSDIDNARRGSYHEPAPDEASVQCLWHNCGRRYTELHGLIDHLHQDHIGTHKKRYTCEWVGCSRKSRTQTSRFALLSHLRSHTGEKPFTCPLVDCDKSFTRSDALAKHMRAQHQMVPIPTRRAKPRRSLRKPGEQGSDSEEEAVEMVTLSDYEPIDKPAVVIPAGARGRRFSDAALGIEREPLGSESEEYEIRQVRIKAAELMRTQHGIGAGTIPDDDPDRDGSSASSPASTDVSADEDETEDEPMVLGSPPLRRPNPLDLINNTAAGPSGESKNGKHEGERRPLRNKPATRAPKDYKKRFLVSKAKYQFLQAEHHEMVRELAQLREDYLAMQEYKSDELNAALTLELGEDVEAIFSPPGTPPPMQSYTEQRGGPPFGY